MTWGWVIGAPHIIQRIDDRTLLLEHCHGLSFDRLGAHQEAATKLLGTRIAMLHTLPIIDPDIMPLRKAMALRAHTALEDLSIDVSILPKKHQQTYLLAVDLIKELTTTHANTPKLSVASHSILFNRVPCHRDLTKGHLRFSGAMSFEYSDEQRQADLSSRNELQLRIIDWGQSRLDTWTSDWVHLSIAWQNHPRLWRIMWQSYWQHRSSDLDDHDRSITEFVALNELNRALALHAINTLRWSTKHRVTKHEYADVVWARGLKELSVLLTRLKADQCVRPSSMAARYNNT